MLNHSSREKRFFFPRECSNWIWWLSSLPSRWILDTLSLDWLEYRADHSLTSSAEVKHE